MSLFRITWDERGEDTEIVEEDDLYCVLVYILEEWADDLNRSLVGVADFIADNGGRPVIYEHKVNSRTPMSVLQTLKKQAIDLFAEDSDLESVFLESIGVSVERIEDIDCGHVEIASH